eukprot:3494744-Rhodomonas_salina.1
MLYPSDAEADAEVGVEARGGRVWWVVETASTRSGSAAVLKRRRSMCAPRWNASESCRTEHRRRSWT